MRVARYSLMVLAVCVASLLAGVHVAAQDQGFAWLTDGRPNEMARQAVAQLQAASEDGLTPAHYLAPELSQNLDRLSNAAAPDPILAVAFSQRLTEAMTQYLNDLALGRVSASDVQHRFDGGVPRQFDASLALRQALSTGDLSIAVEQARPTFPLYQALRQALLQYQALSNHPAWTEALPMPAGRKLEQGQPYPGLTILEARLRTLGDLNGPYESSGVFDATLVTALETFQERHGLTVDGILGPQTLAALNTTPSERADQIALSMERVRWTPLMQGNRVIAVNIPGFMLYAYEIDQAGRVDLALEMRVVVGQINRRTPVFDEDMRYIEFSPYWNIPYSIARRDTIPALRADPDYLNRQQMEFVDSSGQVSTTVTPEVLQAVLNAEKRIRQRPGPQNALGSIKFILPNNQNIFLHHTPSTQLFECERRAFSSGCVRVEDPLALAMFVLGDDPDWPEDVVWQAMHAGESKTVRLRHPVPVIIAYSTVMPKDGVVRFYPDLYGHDVTLRKALDAYRGLQ